jgi:hypothetical protein
MRAYGERCDKAKREPAAARELETESLTRTQCQLQLMYTEGSHEQALYVTSAPVAPHVPLGGIQVDWWQRQQPPEPKIVQ